MKPLAVLPCIAVTTFVGCGKPANQLAESKPK